MESRPNITAVIGRDRLKTPKALFESLIGARKCLFGIYFQVPSKINHGEQQIPEFVLDLRREVSDGSARGLVLRLAFEGASEEANAERRGRVRVSSQRHRRGWRRPPRG